MSKSVNIGYGLLAFVLGIVSLSCESKAKEEESAKKEVVEAPALEIAKVAKGQLSSSLRIPGELIAFQQVDIYAKVSSFVKKLHVDVGSEVKAGQLLAMLEAPEMTAQLAGAESRLKSQEAIYLVSKAVYDRMLETSKTPGTVSQNDLDIAFAKQKSDLAQLESAKSAFREVGDTRNYLEIRAPFSGVVSVRNVSTGAFVGPSGKGSELPMFTLVEQSKLRLVVSVPEAYTSYLQKNSTVTFTVKSLPNHDFSAKVARLSGTLDLRLRSQRTEMDVANPGRKLLPGMIAEVSIPLGSNPGTLVVPKSAVLNSTRGVYLLKVNSNQVSWLPIKPGRSDSEQTEVYGDFQEGDVIIKKASEEIRDGSTVKTI